MRGAVVDEPRVFGVGGVCGVCGVRGHHNVCSMSRHEESDVVRVFRVGGVVFELMTCWSRFASSFSALLSGIANLSAIVVGSWHILLTLFGVEAPPSSRFLDDLHLLAEGLSFLRGIGPVDLFLLDLVFGHRQNSKREFVLLTSCYWFGRGSL